MIFTNELTEFIHGGNSIYFATRDEELAPYGARAQGAWVETAEGELTAYLLKASSSVILKNLRQNGHAALVICRPSSNRTVQLKGRFLKSADCTAEDEERVARQFGGFIDDLSQLGISPASMRGWSAGPCVALRLRITELFDQTPGPGAGRPLA